jgi:hypothetical protein
VRVLHHAAAPAQRSADLRDIALLQQDVEVEKVDRVLSTDRRTALEDAERPCVLPRNAVELPELRPRPEDALRLSEGGLAEFSAGDGGRRGQDAARGQAAGQRQRAALRSEEDPPDVGSLRLRRSRGVPTAEALEAPPAEPKRVDGDAGR